MFPRPNFFEGSTLNFAYNLLYPSGTPDLDSTAIISVTESTTKEITWQQLRTEVILLATAMHAHGLRPYDRVAGFLGNHHNTVIAMLATTWLGAIWTGISADQGVGAVLDRLVQIKPLMLFADNAVEHSGKVHESATKTKEIIKNLPTLRAAVVFETVPGFVDVTGYNVAQGKAWSYTDFLARYVTVSSFQRDTKMLIRIVHHKNQRSCVRCSHPTILSTFCTAQARQESLNASYTLQPVLSFNTKKNTSSSAISIPKIDSSTLQHVPG